MKYYLDSLGPRYFSDNRKILSKVLVGRNGKTKENSRKNFRKLELVYKNEQTEHKYSASFFRMNRCNEKKGHSVPTFKERNKTEMGQKIVLRQSFADLNNVFHPQHEYSLKQHRHVELNC